MSSQHNEPPYITKRVVEYYQVYNPKYGDDRICTCNHPYYRHFDSYEEMLNVGCKYCGCDDFRENTEEGKMSRRDELIAELAALDASEGDREAIQELKAVWSDLMMNVLGYDRKEDDILPVDKTEELIAQGHVTVNELIEVVRRDLQESVDKWKRDNESN